LDFINVILVCKLIPTLVQILLFTSPYMPRLARNRSI